MQAPSVNTFEFHRPKKPPSESYAERARLTATPQRSTGKRKEHAVTTPQTPTRKIARPGPRISPISMHHSDMDTSSGEEEAPPATNHPTEQVIIELLHFIADKLTHFSDHHNWAPETKELTKTIVSKFFPDVLKEPGVSPTPSNVADSVLESRNDVLTTKAIEELTKAVHTLNERMDGNPKPSTGKSSASTPRDPQGPRTVVATGPILKPSKAQSKPNPANVIPKLPSPRSPLDSHHPARLVVVSRAGPLAQDRLPERTAVTAINDRLALHEDSKHIRIASARYNYRSNLILMTREDQTGAELKTHAHKFIDILLTLGTSPDAIELVTDDRRFKVRINGLWTGRDSGRINTPEEIAEELKLNNPVMDKVSPTGPPRWVKAEVDLWEQEFSSVVLEFKSEDDAKALLATKRVAAFARFCEVVLHTDRPPVTQCSNCWAYGHHTGRCRNDTKCRICAGPHQERDHRNPPTDDSTTNRQQFKCTNCGDDHPATNRKCAERARAAGTSKETKKQANGGGKTRAPSKKKPTTKVTATPTTTATTTPHTTLTQTTDPRTPASETNGRTVHTQDTQGEELEDMDTEDYMDTEDHDIQLPTEWGTARIKTAQGILKKSRPKKTPNDAGPPDPQDTYQIQPRGSIASHDTYADRFDLILVTEPWWDKIGNDQVGPVAHHVWTPILPIATIPRGHRPRVMAYVNSRPDFSVTLRSDIAQDLDIQVLDIQQANYPTTTIVNIYNQPRSKNPTDRRPDASVRLQTLRLPEDDPVIISGDWNQHHPDWSIGNRPPSTKTRQLVEWLRGQGYSLLNDKGTPTYFEHRSRGATTVIDLTFANPAAIDLDATKEWTIDDSASCGSDHHALRWVIDHGSAEIENITGTKFNFKDADSKAWKDAFDNELAKNEPRWLELKNLDNPRTPEQLDEDVKLLTDAMKDATTTSTKEKRPSKKAKPWWTDALNDANAERTRLRQQQQAHKTQWGTHCEVIHSSLKKTDNYFKRLFKHERRTWINKTLEEAKPDEIWGFRNWSKGARNYPSPAIKRPNETPAIQHGDKCDVLRNTLSPPARQQRQARPNTTPTT
ncbi:hypothetical protein D9615_009020 [Tricholomella constricta]|uniref:Endonuclease/exonuclease/phosphatase domain-containing protein n=1 Tax=Tricholomella constricta TaxID=117010 RepID=A0A8H5LYW1_9AGAR|nr:hypothetical protein D9615_009020 [Tricholomella constricta]